jgi:hypothetical protein
MRFNALALLGLALLSGAAHAKECSNAILNVTYGLYATGSIINGSSTVPVGLVGVLKYDGRNTFTGTIFQRTNGNITQFTVTGTYSMRAASLPT